VIHGFIDGFSRFVLALQASSNNKGRTVAELFISAVQAHGLPSRVRGDHGVENIETAQLMEELRGPGRHSYLWGRCALGKMAAQLCLIVCIGVFTTSALRDCGQR
jgi:hypothetical protein